MIVPLDKDSAVPQPTVRGDVAIVGMACTFAGARNVAEFWANIVNGVDAISDVPNGRWDPELFYDPDPGAEGKVYCKRGGYLGESFSFDPTRHGTMPRAVEGAEPDQFLVLRTVHEAMEDAGYLGRDMSGQRTSFVLGRGSYLGAGLTALLQRGLMTEQTLQILKALHPEFTADDLSTIKKELHASLPGFCADAAPGLIPNITTGRVANRLDLTGSTFTVDAACASSLIATDLAVRDLLTGQTDMALAGGVHIFTGLPFLQVFCAMGALSRSGVIRPFDPECDGILPGEGAGIVVLKRREDAERDGDRIYAVIKGVGTSSDGRALSVTAPRQEGEELALRRAYAMSGIAPETVGLIEAHGTGLAVGDATEIAALKAVFGPRRGAIPTCAVGSIKSMIGHAMPAAGVAGLIKAALSLYHRVLPPTLHCRQPHPALVDDHSRFYINTETRTWIHGSVQSPRRAGVSAFGFGGVNAHVVLEECTGNAPAKAAPQRVAQGGNRVADVGLSPAIDLDAELFIIEGDNRAGLIGAITRLRDYLDATEDICIRDVAYTLNTCLREDGQRMVILASSKSDLISKLKRAAGRLADADSDQITDRKGLYYFSDYQTRRGKLAFLFPGLGSQYVNMMSDLAIRFPEIRNRFDAADRALSGCDGGPPSADIFPPPAFSKEEAEETERRLAMIDRANPAILTAGGAMFTLLDRLGIRPEMMTGHSSGEWLVMPASGMVPVDAFITNMGRLDGLWQALARDETVPRMAMLSVGADRDTVVGLAAEIGRPIHIANDNCPHQVVVVVDPADVDAVCERLRARGFFTEMLPHQHGYHTPEFTHVTDALRSYFSSLPISEPTATLYSCTTGKPYPAAPAKVVELLAHTFATPLLFRDTIDAMYADGARVFVEVGPRSNLTAFVDDILRGRPHLAVATNHHNRPGISSLYHALGILAALHVPMDLQYLYTDQARRKLSFDPQTDRPTDGEAQGNVMQVSLAYPMMHARRRTDRESRAAGPSLSGQSGPDSSEAPRDTSPAYPVVGSSPPPPPKPVQPPEAEKPVHVPAAEQAGTSPVMREHFRVMEAILQTHEQVMGAYLGRAGVSQATDGTAAIQPEVFNVSSPPETSPVPTPPYEASAADLGTAPSADEDLPATATKTETPAHPSSAEIGSLQEILIDIVSDKTGYPPDMLDLDLNMEADLGIDSIKRIEILGALQRAGEAELAIADKDIEEITQLNTLREVINVLDRLQADAGPGKDTAAADNDGAVTVPDAGSLPFAGRVIAHTPDREVVVRREIDLAEDLYLQDHCFDPDVSAFDPDRERLSIVPLTVTVEMMVEVASLLMPNLRVVGVKKILAGRWIDVEPGGEKVVLDITAARSDVVGQVNVSVCQGVAEQSDETAASPTVAEGVVLFADSFPSPPPIENGPLQNSRAPRHTAEQMYAHRHMFHGPRFQGVASIDAVGDEGLLAQLEVLPTENLLRSNSVPKFSLDPFLLDAAGQLVGYWPVEFLREGYVLFPLRIHELTCYRENLNPGERATCHLRIREVNQRQLRADMDIITSDGQLWMRISGWEDWRFYWPAQFYNFWRRPNKEAVSERLELPLPHGCEDIECRRMVPVGEMGKGIWEKLWAHLILSSGELVQYRAIEDEARRTEWILGRAAAKDAVRMWVKSRHGLDLYPADVHIGNDPQGRPTVGGAWVDEINEVPFLSIAHKRLVALAVAGSCNLGIDLEPVAPCEGGFLEMTFSEPELKLLGQVNGASAEEWLTRAWCAKEAAGKAIGVGLNGNPRTLVIQSIDADKGDLMVAYHGPGPMDGPARSCREFIVHSVREDDLVLALAFETGCPNVPA